MKKLFLLALILVGSALSTQLLAQSDVDYTNTTTCNLTMYAKSDDGTNSCIDVGPTVSALPPTSTPVTITCIGAPPNFVFQIFADDGFGNFAFVGDPSRVCTGPYVTFAIIPAGSAGCISGASVLFTPATSTSNVQLAIF